MAIIAGIRLSNKYLQFDKESWKGLLGHTFVVIVGVLCVAKLSFADGKELLDIPKRLQKD